MEKEQGVERVRRPRRSARDGFAGLWAAFVALIFLWQTVAYSGVVALVAEWQFNEFGWYRPALTYCLFVLVLAPLPLLFRRRRVKRLAGESSDTVVDERPAALRSASRFLKLLLVLAGAAFGAALLSLIATALLPSDAGAVQHLSASDTLPVEPREGATALSGKILYNRTSAFDENLLLVRRTVRFAPVIEEGTDETAIRYFVELPPNESSTPSGSVRRGILKRDALPGELLRLYRYAGFRVFPNHYVLFSNAEPMRWPYLVLALEFAIGGLLLLLAAAVQWFRRRRLRDRPQGDPQGG